jgi:hypothetical protein
MPEYPGLGLPLRHFPQQNYGFYPMGAHVRVEGPTPFQFSNAPFFYPEPLSALEIQFIA